LLWLFCGFRVCFSVWMLCSVCLLRKCGILILGIYVFVPWARVFGLKKHYATSNEFISWLRLNIKMKMNRKFKSHGSMYTLTGSGG
jgi:hypothetical protein